MGAHVLVVDDHRDNRDALGDDLRKHNLRVSAVADAVAARSAVANNGIDLVVLDVMMPGEDGLSLCRHIREVHDLPVILLTARAEQADRIVGLEIGADDYMVKPFDPRAAGASEEPVEARRTTTCSGTMPGPGTGSRRCS